MTTRDVVYNQDNVTVQSITDWPDDGGDGTRTHYEDGVPTGQTTVPAAESPVPQAYINMVRLQHRMEQVIALADQTLLDLAAIRTTAPLTMTNVATGQAAVQQLQEQVKTEAKVLQGAVKTMRDIAHLILDKTDTIEED